MAKVERPSGVRITLPDNVRLTETIREKRRRRIAFPGYRPVPIADESPKATAENDSIISALVNQEMTLVDSWVLDVTPKSSRDTGGFPSGPAPLAGDTQEVELSLKPKEDAVLLLERNGVFSWQYPDESTIIPGQPHRGIMRESGATRTVKFTIPLDETTPAQKGRTVRGPIQDFIVGKIRAYVLKFVANIAVGQTIKFLERNIEEGIVEIDSINVENWKIKSVNDLVMPRNRAARVLLFIHGTFSSTVGGFGTLTSTPWGRKFLEGAFATYDAVLGYNHVTLSEDPLANALNLLKILQSYRWKYPPHIDVITHSRGGLVYRSLVEKVLPASGWSARFDRAVFVACTNGGTELASAKNWKTMIDLYTNILVGTCRLISLIPQAKGVTTIVGEVFKGLGAFVKYCASNALEDNAVPGLAAMQPNGEFVDTLNKMQPGQPTPDKANYYAVLSDFEPSLFGDKSETKELPSGLAFWLRDKVIDQVMQNIPNDLFVDTPSMVEIDPDIGTFIKDKLDYGKNKYVYHTNYFTQPETINALARWLRIIEPATGVERRVAGTISPPFTRPKRSRRSTALTLIRPGTSVRDEIPVMADTDFVITDAYSRLGDVKAELRESAARNVVVSRDHYGETLMYAFAAEEMLGERTEGREEMPVLDALELHEDEASPVMSPSELREVGNAGTMPVTRRTVIVEDGNPAGVVTGSHKILSAEEIVEMARNILTPERTLEAVKAEQSMPKMTSRGFEETMVEPVKVPPITCNFHAEMPEEVKLNDTVTVEVMVSREIIGRLTHAAAAGGVSPVDPQKKLIIQVIPRRNFVLVPDMDDRIVIDPPPPNNPCNLYFDVESVEEGEGEVWVVTRQGQIPLVTLVLKPRITLEGARLNSKTRAEAATHEVAVLQEPLNQLNIIQTTLGDKTVYRYEINSPFLNIVDKYFSDPITGDHQQYIDNLYREIEDRWIMYDQDAEAFTQELRAFGGQLFGELFPSDLQKVLWENRERIGSIMVISDEPFIPWEMVHLKNPNEGTLPDEMSFLGQMGLIRWLHGAGWPPSSIKLRKNRVEYVIPHYPPEYQLTEAEKESKYLEDIFSAFSINPQPEPVRKEISQPGRFDLFHFAGHGSAEHTNISNAKLMLEGRVEDGTYYPAFLSSAVIEQFCKLEMPDNRPLVVINACQSGRAGYKLTGLGGFAQAFLKGGAGAFVGSLWSVGDKPARTFTEELYTRLIDGERLSQAVIGAREKARSKGDATWLAYTVYGFPHMRVSYNQD